MLISNRYFCCILGESCGDVSDKPNSGYTVRACGRSGVAARPAEEGCAAARPSGEGARHRPRQANIPQWRPHASLHSGQDLIKGVGGKTLRQNYTFIFINDI